MNENNVVEEKSPNEILEQSADKLAEIAEKLSDIFRAGYDAGFIGSKNAALLEAYKQEILDYINEQLDLLISGESADGILNTINEISKALNNDANAFATLMNKIEDRTKLIPIERGGTGATKLNDAKSKLGIPLSLSIGNNTGSDLGDNCWYKICDIISGAWVSHYIRMDLTSGSKYDFPDVVPTNIVLLVAANGSKKADPIVYLNSGDDRILKHLYVVQNPNNTDGPFEIWYKNPKPFSHLGVNITAEDCRLGGETYEHITLATGWNTPSKTHTDGKTAYCMADYVQNNLKPKLKDIEGAPTRFLSMTSGPKSDDPDSPSEAGKNITGYEQWYYKTGMRRDDDGRCSVIGPSQPKHIANMEYVNEQDIITLKSANEYTDDKITKLVGGAPGALDTLCLKRLHDERSMHFSSGKTKLDSVKSGDIICGYLYVSGLSVVYPFTLYIETNNVTRTAIMKFDNLKLELAYEKDAFYLYLYLDEVLSSSNYDRVVFKTFNTI